MQWENGGWLNGVMEKQIIGPVIYFLKNIESIYFFIFELNILAADEAIYNFQYLTTHNNYSNQVYLIILRINNKQMMLNYCNALSSVVFTKMVRLNTIMLIFYQLFPRCCHRRLVVVVIVGISLSLLAYHLRCRRLFVVAVVVFLLSFLASRHHLCIVHGGGGVPPHG